MHWVMEDNGLSSCEVEYRKKFLVDQGTVHRNESIKEVETVWES